MQVFPGNYFNTKLRIRYLGGICKASASLWRSLFFFNTKFCTKFWETVHPIHVVCIVNIYSLNSVWSHIFLFDILLGRRPSEFTAILMLEFWREATAASVPGFLCQSGRRRPENVSILSSLLSRELSHEQPFLLLIYYLARPTKTAMLRRLAAGGVLSYLLLINKVLSLSVVVTSGDDVFTKWNLGQSAFPIDFFDM